MGQDGGAFWQKLITGVPTVMLSITQLLPVHTLPSHSALELSLSTAALLITPVLTVMHPITQHRAAHALPGLAPELERATLRTVQLVRPVPALTLAVTPPLLWDAGRTHT